MPNTLIRPHTASAAPEPCLNYPSFTIGNICVHPPVILAPMADVTNGPFRRVCKRIGNPGLIVTEQISTMALHYGSARTRKMIDWLPEEQPLSVQLFGADPLVMAEAARVVEASGAAIVDINMGCWVPKVCRQGAGAALLKDEPTALRVVEAVVNAVSVPVTVKMRAGWDLADLTSVTLAKQFERLGVKAFTLHGRTAKQGFHGDADWRWIADIKQAVEVPVIGNGDVKSPADALRMLQETGCDGVMIGRAAIGNPWILRDVGSYLLTGVVPPAPSLCERIEAAMEHVTDLAMNYGEDHAVRHLRGQLPQYVRGWPGASKAREEIVRSHSIAEVRAIFQTVVIETEEMAERTSGAYRLPEGWL